MSLQSLQSLRAHQGETHHRGGDGGARAVGVAHQAEYLLLFAAWVIFLQHVSSFCSGTSDASQSAMETPWKRLCGTGSFDACSVPGTSMTQPLTCAA